MNVIEQGASIYKSLERPGVSRRGLLHGTVAVALLFGAVYMSFQNYLLFHSLIELFSIVIAFMMLAIAVNTGWFLNAQFGFISIMGIMFGIVGFFDLLHVLAFKGMGVFPDNTANLPTELWIVARFLESVALLITSVFLNNRTRIRRVLASYVVLAVILFASVFIYNVFPDCYIDGYGLTPFKKTSEIVISLILFASAIFLFLKKRFLQSKTYWLLMTSVFLTIVSEIAFIFYVDVYGLSNMVGHVFKVASFYLIYKALVEVNLRGPVIELARSEKKYADLIERLPEAILIYDDDGIAFANTASARLFGRERLQEQFAFLSGDLAESDPGDPGDPDRILERRIVRPNGSLANVEIRLQPFRHQGRQAKMAIIYDVTERKVAELTARRNAELQIEAEMLRRNETVYLEILNGSTEASWIYDFESDTLNYSHEWKQRIGGERVPDEKMNFHALSIVHPDDVENVIRQRKAIYIDKPTKYACEYRLRTKDVGYIWVYEQGKVVYGENGLPVKMYGTSMDISMRKHAEQAMKAQNILLQNIIENTYDNITVINPDGSTLYGQNKTMEPVALLNGHAGAAAGTDAHDGTTAGTAASAGEAAVIFCGMDGSEVPPEQRPANRIRSGETIKDEVYLVKSPAGSRYLLFGGKPVYGEGDQFLYGIIYSHDLTELISIQNALKESEQTALKLVDELKAVDRNKNEFINSLSHELRNPLAAIVAGFSLINITDDRQKIIKAKAIMQRQINQLCRLVDDLLDLTRITNNKIVLKRENVELVGLVSTVVEDQQLLFANKGISLDIRKERHAVHVSADPVRIKQIIGNLLQNAAKFTDHGGTVSVTVAQSGPEAVVRIKDSGIGIRPEFLQSLFEPFRQANTSIDRSDGGLGLGLSIVKGIADLHGGHVRAYSEGLGKGSEFVISLPVLA